MPLARSLAPRAALVLRLAMALACTALAVELAVAVLGLRLGDAHLERWGAYDVVLILAVVLCAARAVAVERNRTAWIVLSAGMASWVAGSLYWEWVVGADPAPAWPGPADILWIAFYPAAYVGMMLLLRSRARRFTPSVWLDGLLGGCAVAALAVALVIDPLAESAGSLAAAATNLAYPLADLLLVTFGIGGFALMRWRPGWAWALLLVAFLTIGAGDALYLLGLGQRTYEAQAAINVLWPAGMLLIAFAAWQRPERRRAPSLEGWGMLLFPFAFTALTIGLLVYGALLELPAAAVWLATLAVATAFLRTALAFRDMRTLGESRRQAITDDLTGLPNRRLLLDRLDAAVLGAARDGGSVGFLLIDLDGFKELNDTLGHRAGDLLLEGIGGRLAGGLREGDLLARLGGDEFGVLLPGTEAVEAMQVAERLRARLHEPFVVEDMRLDADASVGVAVYPAHAGDTDALMQRADVAMYTAKGARTGCELYDPDRDCESRDHRALIADLRAALETDQLVLHYQPKARLGDGGVGGVEALVRWEHPERGLIPPMSFIPAAEQAGLMRPLTLHVLDRALAQCTAWRREGLELSVAVNLSAANLLDLGMPGDVGALLARHRVPPHSLVLEVTETVLMADPERATEVLRRLRALGVVIALDDFGTGYSSLSYLKRLAIDELKIDKSFVLELAQDTHSAAIVRSTVELACALGLRAVAEGVEDEASWAMLREFGCTLAQGYLLSRPLPAAELTRWLRERDSEASAVVVG